MECQTEDNYGLTLKDRLCSLVLPDMWDQNEDDFSSEYREEKRRLEVIIEESQSDLSDKKSELVKVKPRKLDGLGNSCCCIS